jgi:hypothetical protein
MAREEPNPARFAVEHPGIPRAALEGGAHSSSTYDSPLTSTTCPSLFLSLYNPTCYLMIKLNACVCVCVCVCVCSIKINKTKTLEIAEWFQWQVQGKVCKFFIIGK